MAKWDVKFVDRGMVFLARKLIEEYHGNGL